MSRTTRRGGTCSCRHRITGDDEVAPLGDKLRPQVRTELLATQVDITAVTRPKLDKAKDLLAKIEPYYPAEPAPVGAGKK